MINSPLINLEFSLKKKLVKVSSKNYCTVNEVNSTSFLTLIGTGRKKEDNLTWLDVTWILNRCWGTV